MLLVINAGAQAEPLPASVFAVGERASTAANIVDTSAGAQLDLTSFWSNRGTLQNAWATLDLGGAQLLTGVNVAPRADRDYTLAIHVGDILNGGQVDNPSSTQCSVPGTGTREPAAVTFCPLPAVSGRYVTVRSVNRRWFTLYGAQAVGEGGTPANQLPLAVASATPDGLTVTFDGSASSDPDGAVVGWDWTFGDGNADTGEQVTYQYTAAGVYNVTLTVTDELGATGTSMLTVTLQPPDSGNAGLLQPEVLAVGARSGIAWRALDQLADGSQNFSTFWRSDSAASTRWITLDFGATETLSLLRIAVDRAHDLQLLVGDNLQSDQVSGGSSSTCNLPDDGNGKPTSLVDCPIGATGRYLTLIKTNGGPMRLHGLQLLGLIGNQPPLIAPIGDQMVTAGEAFDRVLAATDADGPPPLSFGASHNLPGAPNLLIPLSPGSARLLWDGTAGNTGSYPITVTASDGDGASSSETFTLDVVDNQAPSITPIADQTISAEQPFSLMLSASDPEGTAPVQFSTTHNLPGAPQVLTDNGDDTALFAWTPSSADIGVWTITLIATDVLGASSSSAFDIIVVEGQPPIIAPIADQMLVENTTTDVPVTATDPDGPGGITLTASTDLPGQQNLLTDNGDGSGTVTLSPATGDAGNYTVSLSATGGDGRSSSESFGVVVAAEPPMGTLAASTGDITGQVIDLTAEGVFDWRHWGRGSNLVTDYKVGGGIIPDYSVINGNAHALTRAGARYAWSDGMPSMTTGASGTDDAMRLFSATPAFELRVPALLTPQRLELFVGLKGSNAQLTLSLSDNSAAPLTLDLTQGNARSSRRISIDYRALTPGAELLIHYAMAGTGDYVSFEAAALAEPPNEPPVLAPIADQQVIRGAVWSTQVSASDDGPLTFSATHALPGNPEIVTNPGNGSADLTWQPPVDAEPDRAYPIEVTVSDAFGATDSTTFTLTVLGNDAPQWQPIADRTLIEGDVVNVALFATDPDGPAPLTLSASHALPGGGAALTDDGAGTGTFSWRAPAGAAVNGPYPVSFTATDAANAAAATGFTLTVLSNLPPMVAPIADQTVVAGTSRSLTVAAADVDGPLPLSFTVSGAPSAAGVSLQDNGDGSALLTLAPTPEATGGPYTVTVRASDAFGITGSTAFALTVAPNQAPTLSVPVAVNLREGDRIELALNASDPDGPMPISLSAIGTPPALEVSLTDNGDGTGLLSLTANSGSATTTPATVQIQAQDGFGNQTSASLAISVSARPLLRYHRGPVPQALNLTDEGQLDWMHWGLDRQANAVNRKLGATPLLSASQIGTENVALPVVKPAVDWIDGTPQRFVSGSTDAIRYRNIGSGFRVNAEATDSRRRLTLYIAVNRAQVRVIASGAGTGNVLIDEPDGRSTHRLVYEFDGGATLDTLTVAATVEAGYTGVPGVSLIAATLSPATDNAALTGVAARPDNLACMAPERPELPPRIDLLPAYAGLTFNDPVDLAQAPGDPDRWYVLERSGRLRHFDAGDDATDSTTLWLDSAALMAADAAHGTLAMAFAPDFAATGRFYLSYLRDAPSGQLEQVLARFTAPATGPVDPAAAEILLVQPFGSGGNFGGALRFGSDGYLYWGLGDDGADGQDPANFAQNPDDRRGSVLRLDVSGPAGYAIPGDNPFASTGMAPEVYDIGVRDPRNLTLLNPGGTLLLTDQGHREAQFVRRLGGGANHGWRCYDGFQRNAQVDTSGCPDPAELTFPVAQYDREEGTAVRGGAVYGAAAIPYLQDRFLFADAGSRTLWGLFPTAPGRFDRRRIATTSAAPAVIAADTGGDVLVLLQDGTLHRLHNAGANAGSAPSTLLSGTGCVDVATPATPLPGVLPLGLNSSAFRDGASAERFLALPDGRRLSAGNDSTVRLPDGAVAVQHLRRNDRLIETRLLVRHHDGGYGGYSYAWNGAQTDATLVAAGGQTVQIDGEPWQFPARAECASCHGTALDQSPGLELEQLNTSVTYPGGSGPAAQLPTWEHIGWFDAPLLTSQTGPATVDAADSSAPPSHRARSYLHANCAQCHQPGGNAPPGLDLRFRTPLARTGVCDVPPRAGALGISNARIVAPGDPSRSVLLARMSQHDANRMPPLGTATVDSAGVALISTWIQSLETCPLPPPLPPLVDAGSATENIQWNVPERVTALGKETSEMWLSGFIDMSWWNGYEGFVIDPSGVQDSTDGINEVVRVAHDFDVAVYAPPGTYRVTREISLKRENHPGINCRSASRKTNVFIGDPTNPPTFVLDANPQVDFSDPDRPRPVFHLWTQDGPGGGGIDCELPEHDPANADYDVNGVLYNANAPNGFRQLLRNVRIDLGTGAKAGATCFKAQAAQATWVENIDCEARGGFAGATSLPGRLGAAVDVEVRGGRHCLWLNEGGTAEFALNLTCTGQSGAVFGANGRAPTNLIGFEIEHDLSTSPVFRTLDEAFHNGSGAGTTQFIDGRITLTGASSSATNPVWRNSLGRNWHIANVYVSGAAPGQTLIDSEGETVSQPASGTWVQIEQYQYTARDLPSAPITDPGSIRVRYDSNESFTLIDGAPLAQTTIVRVNADAAPPADIRTQHELASTPFFLEPDVVNTLTDLGITNRGDRDVTAELQAAIDNHDRVFVPKGIYFVGSPGLLLQENTTLFSHNVAYTRIFRNPSYTGTAPDGSALISTVDSATATTRFEGFTLYRYGADGDELNYAQTLVNWRAGAKSVWGWGWGDVYAGGQAPLIGHPGKQYRYTGNGGGRRLMFFDGDDDKTVHADHHRLVIENTTGQPLTLYTHSPEHEEGPHPFLQIRNASNVRVFGNKSECTRRFAEIDSSSNIALFGQGVGCTSQNPPQPPNGGYVGPDVGGLPVIRILGDSTDVLVAHSVPLLWHPTALSLQEQYQGQTNSYPTGTMVSLFKRGEVDISGQVFDHQPP